MLRAGGGKVVPAKESRRDGPGRAGAFLGKPAETHGMAWVARSRIGRRCVHEATARSSGRPGPSCPVPGRGEQVGGPSGGGLEKR